jgi:MoxR-like ATPase
MIKTTVGYPSDADEAEIMNRRNLRMKDDFDVTPVTTPQMLVRLQEAVERVYVHPQLVHYIARIVGETRRHDAILAGGSPRGSLALLKLSKSKAAVRGRGFVVPDDVQSLVKPVLAHRLILEAEPRIRGVRAEDVLDEIVRKVPVPKL